MPRTGSRTKKRKFHGNRFTNSAKKARLGSETDSAGQSTFKFQVNRVKIILLPLAKLAMRIFKMYPQ